MTPPTNARHPRRQFLRTTTLAGLACLPVWALPAQAAEAPRGLAMHHLHTQESIDLVYANGAERDPLALTQFNSFLRDHYTGDVGSIDPTLLDVLHEVRRVLDNPNPFEIFSGYRSPATNQHLREVGAGGVARKSLHMEGRAIDVRLPGTDLVALRDAALSLQAGGVGFYAKDGFVHLDTGRVRNW